MKKYIITAISLCFALQLEAQLTTSENYIQQIVYTTENSSSDVNNSFRNVTYYDGLGRPEQVVQVRSSPVYNSYGYYYDMITPIEYDGAGRQPKEYLPYSVVSGSGAYRADAVASQKAWYKGRFNQDIYGYTETAYEASPLQRPEAVWGVGAAYRDGAGKKTTSAYSAAAAEDCVLSLSVREVNNVLRLYADAGYRTGLYKTTMTDEDGRTAHNFTDLLGNTVLTRTVDDTNQANVKYLDTYYVYDDMQRLSWVVSPEASPSLQQGSYIAESNQLARDYCYIYKYSGTGYVTEKKLPGADPVYMVYDKAGRLVMSQDGNMRPRYQWMHNIYDALGRLVKVELLSFPDNSKKHSSFQSDYYNTTTAHSFPSAEVSVLNQYCYNDYNYSNPAFEWTSEVAVCQNVFLKQQFIPFTIPSWCNSSLDYDYLIPFRQYVTVNSAFDAGNGVYYIPATHLESLQRAIDLNYGGSGTYPALELVYTFPGGGQQTSTVTVGGVVERTLGFDYPAELGSGVSYDTRTTNLKTYEKIAVFDGEEILQVPDENGYTVPQFVERAFYYDYKGRLIQTVEKNHLGGLSRYSTKYDFVGNVLATHEYHRVPGKTTDDVKLTQYTYHQRGHLLSETTTLNDGEAAVVNYKYDHFGKIIEKTYGTGTNAITEGYKYNIQGWLTEQTSDHFGMKLHYYDTELGTKPSYTGNITEWEWGHRGADLPKEYPDPGYTIPEDPYIVVPVMQGKLTNFSGNLTGNLAAEYPYYATAALRYQFRMKYDTQYKYFIPAYNDLYNYLLPAGHVVNNTYPLSDGVTEIYVPNPDYEAQVSHTTANPWTVIPLYTDMVLYSPTGERLSTSSIRDAFTDYSLKDGYGNYEHWADYLTPDRNYIQDKYRFTVNDGTTEHVYYYIPKFFPFVRRMIRGDKSPACVSVGDLPAGTVIPSELVSEPLDPFIRVPVRTDVLMTTSNAWYYIQIPIAYAAENPHFLRTDPYNTTSCYTRSEFSVYYDHSKIYLPTNLSQGLMAYLESHTDFVDNFVTANYGIVDEVPIPNPDYRPLDRDATEPEDPYTYIHVFTDRFLYSPTGEDLDPNMLIDVYDSNSLKNTYTHYPNGEDFMNDGDHETIRPELRFTVHDGETERVYYYIPRSFPSARCLVTVDPETGAYGDRAWATIDELPEWVNISAFVAVRNPGYIPPENAGYGTPNAYAFTYDQAGRLTDSRQYFDGEATNQFVERGIEYDRNGNIRKFKRYAEGELVDDFETIAYNGNQFFFVRDAVSSTTFDNYSYDKNGNCTVDALNALKLKYNFLNLTAEAQDESDNSLLATYRWTADGAKAGVKNAAGTSGFEYVGSLIYSRNGNALELESTGFGGGRFQVTDTGDGQNCTPNYFLTDHLGSTRVVLNNQGVGQERNDYYAFGGRWDVGLESTSANRFRFSGKEDQTTGDLPFQDFGARFLNKRLPVFTGPDPLAEVRPWESPYIYCGSNPVNRTDPTGMVWYEEKEEEERKKEQQKAIAESKQKGAERNAQSDTWGQGSSGRAYIPQFNAYPAHGQALDGTEEEAEQQKKPMSSKILKATTIVVGALVADDVSGIGVADDVLILPVAGVGAMVAGIASIFEEKPSWYYEFKPHTQKGDWDKHSGRRAGGDPENGQYGKNRNDNRGNKNKKYIPPKNPNKR